VHHAAAALGAHLPDVVQLLDDKIRDELQQ
jgi:hypothetical protein